METCRNCWGPVLVMCRRGTGFCTENCENQYAEDDGLDFFFL